MFKINLVPEIQQQKAEAAKRNTYSTIIAITILAVTVVTLLIIGSIRVASGVSLSSTNKKIDEVKKDSEQYAELEATVLSLEKGLSGINQIFNGDNSWTKLLPHLEKATPNDAAFTSLKLDGNSIDAELRGESVNSLARFIQSYKEYKIVALSGTATGKTIEISVDGSAVTSAVIKNTGAWNAAITLDPNKNHEISATIKGQEPQKLNYDSKTKAVTWESSQVSATVQNLFASVESTEYKKDGGSITFNAKITFAKELLW